MTQKKRFHVLTALFSYVSLTLLPDSGYAQSVSVRQPEILPGGIINQDGREIQLQLTFSNPLSVGSSLSVEIADQTVFKLHNRTSLPLTRFTTRLRLKAGESLELRRSDEDVSAKTVFQPVVSRGHSDPVTDEYKPAPRIRSVAGCCAMQSTYGAETGDCVYLILGVSNSGASAPKWFELKTDAGSVFIDSSNRIASNPLFSIGSSRKFSQCDLSIMN